MKILVVDDDLELLALVAFALRQGGFLAIEAASGERALALIAEEEPDLVVLDVNLPGIDGFEVCRRLRAERNPVPVLMLTVRGDEEDVVQGLELGADDYLTKPFSPRTLLARVRALLRRTGRHGSAELRSGELVLDEELQAVRLGDQPPLRLTPLEFRLLRLLLAHAGQPVPAERILRHVWGARAGGDRQLLKQLVHRLRQKLESDPAHPRRLTTEPGVGYRLAAD
ncbi:MAG: response regulator [Thermoanaerobaculia bacterium]